MALRKFLVFFVIFVAGCASDALLKNAAQYPDAKDHYDYELRIVEYFGAVGVGYDYFVSRDAIIVITRNGFRKKNKEIVNVALSESEREKLFGIIRAVPLADLDSRYWTPMIDGRDMLFEFKVAGIPQREIVVSNYDQPDLMGVFDAVKEVLERESAIQDGAT